MRQEHKNTGSVSVVGLALWTTMHFQLKIGVPEPRRRGGPPIADDETLGTGGSAPSAAFGKSDRWEGIDEHRMQGSGPCFAIKTERLKNTGSAVWLDPKKVRQICIKIENGNFFLENTLNLRAVKSPKPA